jgi:long-chain acyl-CoA synthetase
MNDVASTAAEIDAYVEGKNLPKVFLEMLARNGERVAFRWKNDDDSWSEITWNDFADQVARAATGLAAQGLGRGDRLMMMIRNVYEFHVLDTAALFLGATPVSIYNSSSPEQLEYFCNDAGAKLVIVENTAFYETFSQVRKNLSTLQSLGIVHDGEGDATVNADFTLTELLANEPIDLVTASETAQPDDLATLIYTSGTTGPSKGVMLDHRNIIWTAESLRRSFGWSFEKMAGMRVVSYLPMAHIAERMVSHYQALIVGYEITCCPEASQIAAYASHVRPQIMFGVPRVWEKIYAGINAALAADPEKQKAVAEGVAAGMPIREKMTMGTATPEEVETYEFLDAVAFSTIRELVGLDQLESAITGAAPIPSEMMSWFRTIGVPLSEIYGLSENTGPMTWERQRVKPGYVGVACPGVEVALAEDGEVMCRGGNVFRGYLNQPEKTAEVLEPDGWFHSGDIGEFDDEGYLKIVDRKKELIITAGGKNLSPANLEARLKMIPLVGQACAIGDKKPFVSALVVLDPDAAPGWAAARGIEYASLEELAENPDVVAEVETGLRDAMTGFNNAEKVKKLKILGAEWMPDTELLTPTSKLKRRGIHSVFAEEIEELYS